MVGERVGHYRILKKLASASTGALYVARDPRAGRDVILKILPPDSLSDSMPKQIMIREVAAAQRLHHPHVLANLGLESAEGLTLIAYEHQDLEPLTGVMARGTGSERQVLTLARQILGALDAAHQYGLLHCDLRPDSILLDGRGDAFLVGLGLGKNADRLRGAGKPGELVSQYLAPEQSEKGRCDERSDLFSLAVVLYQWLTGALPFSGTTEEAYRRSVSAGRPVPAGQRAGGISREIDALLITALQGDPARRFQSAREMTAAVGEALARLGPVEPEIPLEALDGAGARARAGFTRRHLWLIGALAAAIALALGAWLLPQRKAPPAVPELGVFLTRVTDLPGVELDPCITPDGSRIVFSSDASGNFDLWTLEMETGSLARITDGPEAERYPCWSPDATEIVYSLWGGNGGIRALSLASREVRELSSTGGRPSWSPLGDAIAFNAMTRTEKPQIWLISPQGEMLRKLTQAEDPAEAHLGPRWSPDGTQVVYQRAVEGESNIWIVSLDSRIQRRLSYPPQWDFDPFWDPLGKWVYFCSGEGDSIHIRRTISRGGQRFQMTTEAGFYSGITISGDGRRIVFSTAEPRSRLWRASLPGHGEDGAPPGEPERVKTDLVRATVPDVSPVDGRMVLACCDRSSWDVCVAEEGRTAWIAAEATDETDPRWSPDGREVAFVERYVGGSSIRVADAGGGALRTIVPAGENLDPRWSPDGGSLCFVRVHGPRRTDILVVDPGTGIEEPVTRAGLNTKPRWSPDGSQILFHSEGESWSGLYAVISGGGVVPRWVAEGKDGCWSADGRGVLYAGGEPGREDIWILEFDEMSNRRLTFEEAGFSDPVPSPDGRWVAFLSNGNGMPDVWVVPLRASARDGKPLRVARDTNLTGPPAWSPDSRWLYFTRPQYEGGDIWMYELR